MNAEPYEDETEDEYYPPQPVKRSSRVYAPPEQRKTEPAPAPKPPRKHRSLVPVAVGMLIVVAALLIVQRVVLPTATWASDQWHYGDARMTQLDADVGPAASAILLLSTTMARSSLWNCRSKTRSSSMSTRSAAFWAQHPS